MEVSEEHLQDTPKHKKEQLIPFLQKIISYVIRFLAVMMILVIFATVADVGYIMYQKIIVSELNGIFHIEEILTVLGAFIAVLIAIEIFNNIIVYMKEDSIHVKLVLATALIAVSRKVIILDYNNVEPSFIYAMGAVILATAIAYWIIAFKMPPLDHH